MVCFFSLGGCCTWVRHGLNPVQVYALLQCWWSSANKVLSFCHCARSSSVVAINLPNGAHHSELSHVFPNDNDTDDVLAGYDTIETVLHQWLSEIKQDDDIS